MHPGSADDAAGLRYRETRPDDPPAETPDPRATLNSTVRLRSTVGRSIADGALIFESRKSARYAGAVLSEASYTRDLYREYA